MHPPPVPWQEVFPAWELRWTKQSQVSDWAMAGPSTANASASTAARLNPIHFFMVSLLR